MADDKNLSPGQNPLGSSKTLDDLVKELSRPQNIPPSSAAPASPNLPPRPISNVSPNPQKPSAPASVKTPGPQPKEYQSSIRTMSDDISKLQMGQQVSGINIPRKIEAQIPASTVTPPIPPRMTPPVPPSKPGFSADLGKAERTGPLSNLPKPPSSFPPGVPPANVPPVTGSLPASSGGPHLAKLLAAILSAVVLGGVLYWYFMLREPEVALSPSSFETETPAPTPDVNNIEEAFNGQVGSISLPESGDQAMAFKSALENQFPVEAGKFSRISVTALVNGQNTELGINELFSRLIPNYPTGVSQVIGTNGAVLLFGQTEAFDAKGKIILGSPVSKKIVIVSEISDPSIARSAMLNWEPTISENMAIISGTSKASPSPFSDNTYQATPIRFKNFPSPDKSLDYGIVSTQNGKNYLIIATSRESMYSAVSNLLSTGDTGDSQ